MSNRYKAAYTNYRHYVAPAGRAVSWGDTPRGSEQRWGDHWAPMMTDPSSGSSVIYPAYPDLGTAVPDLVIDHGNRVVLDIRRNVQAEPKLVIELTADEKDVVIQCRCGDRISLVKLLGLEAVKPLFDTISARVRGLIESLPPPAAKP